MNTAQETYKATVEVIADKIGESINKEAARGEFYCCMSFTRIPAKVLKKTCEVLRQKGFQVEYNNELETLTIDWSNV